MNYIDHDKVVRTYTQTHTHTHKPDKQRKLTDFYRGNREILNIKEQKSHKPNSGNLCKEQWV